MLSYVNVERWNETTKLGRLRYFGIYGKIVITAIQLFVSGLLIALITFIFGEHAMLILAIVYLYFIWHFIKFGIQLLILLYCLISSPIGSYKVIRAMFGYAKDDKIEFEGSRVYVKVRGEE